MSALLRRSMTLRLTLLFAVLSTSVLLVLGLLIGVLVERHFEEIDRALIGGKVELLTQALRRVRNEDELKALPEQLDHALVGHHGLIVIVRAPDGQTIYRSADGSFPSEVLAVGQRPTDPYRLWEDGAGRHYRGLAVEAPMAIEGLAPAVLGIAVDMTQHELFMRSFEWALWSLVGLAALMSGGLGWIAARRGLDPLREISRRAASITADHLDQRLPVASIPAELADVVSNLNDMLARLEASFHRLADFSSDLAHEIRTPVSNVLTQTQVTLSRARSTEEYQDVLASNAEEFERLSRMIADMLFLAKSDNQLLVPQREDVDLRAEIESVIEFYEPLIDEKSIDLTFTGAARVSGDRLMLRRLVNNLLSNAVRHTQAHGRITVDVRPADADCVELSVENTGDAIPEDDLSRIFERFYRVDASRRRFSDGAGLGLAISKAIVRAHGGEISAVSGQDHVTLKATLPTHRPQP